MPGITEEYIRVAESSDLIENKGIVRRLVDDEIALVKSGGCVSAFINICPHQHTPLIDKYGGQITGRELTCPMHGWTYNLGTGECINGNGKLKMLDVEVRDEWVFVKKPVRNVKW
jgi:nitrite reductase/ring-hydroxylating ferredoxin subunit